MANCKYCGGLFEAKRVDALFCSDACRKAHKRIKSDIISDKIKSDTVEDVRDNLTNRVQQKRLNEILNYGQPDCECKHCQQSRANKSKNTINHGDYKPASEMAKNEVNRVSLPGDTDYDGACKCIDGVWGVLTL
jgi:hypothetical protein